MLHSEENHQFYLRKIVLFKIFDKRVHVSRRKSKFRWIWNLLTFDSLWRRQLIWKNLIKRRDYEKKKKKEQKQRKINVHDNNIYTFFQQEGSWNWRFFLKTIKHISLAGTMNYVWVLSLKKGNGLLLILQFLFFFFVRTVTAWTKWVFSCHWWCA